METLFNLYTEGETPEEITSKIHQGQIGHAKPFESPFGTKKVLYCDYTASGRSLDYIEEYIIKEVLPMYANTHTTSNTTANQTTHFRTEARNIIRKAVNASEKDVVIFTGSGSTSAIHKLIHALKFDQNEPPLVFITGQEHHSNLIPWKEAGCEVITINELPTGQINVKDLEAKLSKHHQVDCQRTKVGVFTAASNVSGILNDDLTLTALMHKYQGLAFWDYATAAPYVKIDMNPHLDQSVHKDALYFSMHKFPGGPQTPGILVAKKALFQNPVPHQGGGGTVVYVTQNEHKYISEIEEREEGGTPAIIESIRAGLVMLTKESIGLRTIISKEKSILQFLRLKLKEIPNLVVLGPMDVAKLPILSFLIQCPSIFGSKVYLHHNFVCQILNDLFGIQARGGCACAGPYVEHLLGMTDKDVQEFVSLEGPDFVKIKPGFTRLNLPWFAPKVEILYIVESLRLVSKYGWSLLPQYEYDHQTAEWKHRLPTSQKIHDTEKKSLKVKSWKELMIEAKMSLANAKNMAETLQVEDDRLLFTNGSDHLRWFILPHEAKQILLGETISPVLGSFVPKTFSMPREQFDDVGSYGECMTVSPVLSEVLGKTRSRAIGQHSNNTSKLWYQKFIWLLSRKGFKTVSIF